MFLVIYTNRPDANITTDPASASESCGQVFTESEEVMAEQKKTTTRRSKKTVSKSTQKKEESLLQDQVAPESVVEVAQKPIVEEAPPKKEKPVKHVETKTKQKELSVGSLVKMPIGDKQGTVTDISEKGVVSVKVDLNSNKIYTFLSNELTLL